MSIDGMLNELRAYNFDNDRDQKIATIIKELTIKRINDLITKEEYTELMKDLALEQEIDAAADKEVGLQNMYKLALVIAATVSAL